MAYIDTRVFPTSGRDSSDSDIDIGTNLVTEYNISSLIATLCGKEGFVINDDSASSQTGDVKFTGPSDLEFINKGYYFKLKGFNPSNSSWETEYVKIEKKNNNKIEATINIVAPNNQKSYSYLNTTDDSNYGSSGETYTLTLLELHGNDWYIPGSSRVQFKGYSITNLDEGTL